MAAVAVRVAAGGAGPTKPGRHFPEMDYAIAHGVTMRDDSILVQPPPDSWYHA